MKIHFIGVGGIGISNIASFYKERGEDIQGSDAIETEITQGLKSKIFVGHKKENITNDIDLVIYSEAIKEDNPELKRAKELGIKVFSGAQAMGNIQKDYYTIAVSGMHGKTTTACMIREVFKKAGIDSSYVIGTKNGGHLGTSKYLIIEADDYKAKFLNYYPNALVLTNIDKEHMDYFKNMDHILSVFSKYISQVKDLIIANKSDKNIKKIIKSAKCKVILVDRKNISLSVPGKHNQLNASLVLELAKYLNIENPQLKSYEGTWRRFEEKQKNNLLVISDYAHHPTELEATFQALKEKFKNKKIWVVFQPHQKQRTFYLFNEFAKVLKNANFDKTIITDIYDVKGREEKNIIVSSKDLSQKAGIDYIKQGDLENYLKTNYQNIDILALIGAGDIYKIEEKL